MIFIQCQEDITICVPMSLSGGARSKQVQRFNQDHYQSDSDTPGNSDPNIVQDQYKWTIHNASVNMPALLNDPRLVKRETDFFTKTWGYSFEKVDILPSPYIPEIGREHFEKYIRKTSGVRCPFFQ